MARGTLLQGNSAVLGGAASFSMLNFSIPYFSIDGNHTFDCTLSYSFTAPLPVGTGTFSSDPQFVNAAAGNLRQPATSPSINPDNSANTATNDVYANTNLLQAPQAWTLVPPEQTGTAAALTLTITNSLPGANYRTGVRLP